MEPKTALLISPNHVLLGLQKQDTHFWVEEHVTLKRTPNCWAMSSWVQQRRLCPGLEKLTLMEPNCPHILGPA